MTDTDLADFLQAIERFLEVVERVTKKKSK